MNSSNSSNDCFVLVYQIKLGTIDQLDACDTEWQYRPFMNTTKKRQFLANENDKS